MNHPLSIEWLYLRCDRHSGETTDARRSNSPSESAPEMYSTAALAPSTNSLRLNSARIRLNVFVRWQYESRGSYGAHIFVKLYNFVTSWYLYQCIIPFDDVSYLQDPPLSKYGVMRVVARNQFLAVLTKFGNSLWGKSMRPGILRSSLLLLFARLGRLSGFEVVKKRPRPMRSEGGSKFEFPAGAWFREESKLLARVLGRTLAPRTAAAVHTSCRLSLDVSLIAKDITNAVLH